MKIAVTTPTGNIGRALADLLLDAGREVILLARQPDKVKPMVDRGAIVHQGSLEDRNFVIEATRGADVLFWLTPNDYGSNNLHAYQNMLGDNAVAAIKANKIARVVDVSSVGAHHATGTGPVVGLHDIEKKLEATGAHVTHLRPGYFMENFLMSAQGIASNNAVFLPLPGTARVPFIATSDIATAAADRILDESWTGHSVIELVGPEEMSFDEAATTLGEAVGKQITHVETTPEQTRDALTSMGVHENTAELFLELYAGMREGKLSPETPPKTGTTTLGAFANEVFRPTFEAMTK